MQVSALAETVIGDYTYYLPEDGGAMAMPVEASIVHEDEDAEFQRDMRTAIRISGEEEVDYGDALSPPTEAAVGSALADQLMPDITLPPAEMLVDGGAIVLAGTDAPVAVLTAQDVRAQGGKPDLAPFEGAPRIKVSPSSQIGYQARTSILPIPDNISVFVIAGFPGCGADVVAKNTAKMAAEYKVVVARIDTDRFLGDNSRPCDVCVDAQNRRPSVRPHKCRLGPASINVDFVNATINAEVEKMQHRPRFVQGIGKGLIFLEGAYPLAIKAYADLCGDNAWYFYSMDMAKCKKALLKQRGIWDEGYGPDSDYIAQVEARDSEYIWRLFYHAQVWRQSVISFAPRGENLIDVDKAPDAGKCP
jgi:hypothetical protein